MALAVDIVKVLAIICVVVQHVILLSTGEEGVAFKVFNALGAPLFFVVAGFLCHEQPIVPYYMKKIWRVLVPFLFFCVLKLVFTQCTGMMSHADTLGGRLYDAFVIGRVYWFAYTIMGLFLIAPLFWRAKSPMVLVALAIGAFAFHWLLASRFPCVFQIRNIFKYLPLFLIGYALRMMWRGEIVRPKDENPIIMNIAKYTWQIMLMEGFFRVLLFMAVPIHWECATLIRTVVFTPILIAVCILTCKVCERAPFARRLIGV